MKEEFLHFVWKNKLFDSHTFSSLSGELVEVIDPGTYNRDSGPDFFNSRIKVGNTIWAGNIEIHLKSSEWISHGHQDDHAYDNVILHVVHLYDREVMTASGIIPDTAILKWNDSIYGKYQELLENPETIACNKYIHLLELFSVRHWIHTLAVERLKRKTEIMKPVLVDTSNDWEETLYRLLAMYFGMNVNSEPFKRLATILPLKLIRKHADNLLQVEALLFGQAGMLEEGLIKEALSDDYYLLLIREYEILKSKYSLKPMDGWLWKFHRMRQINFPTLRISQLASLMSSGVPLFSKVKQCKSIKSLRSLFRAESSSYWKDHYMFGRFRKGVPKRTGDMMIDLLLLNTVIPLLFLYGMENNLQVFCDDAIDIADSIPPERNRVTREWEKLGIEASTAFESQGLLELKDRHCKLRACLNCHIGSNLIILGKDFEPGRELSLEEPIS